MASNAIWRPRCEFRSNERSSSDLRQFSYRLTAVTPGLSPFPSRKRRAEAHFSRHLARDIRSRVALELDRLVDLAPLAFEMAELVDDLRRLQPLLEFTTGDAVVAADQVGDLG